MRTETEERSAASVDVPGRGFFRAGTATLLAGFIIAVAAAAVLGRQVPGWESAASAAHRIGVLAMLCGFCLLLASYRAAQIRDWWRRRAAASAEDAQPASSEMNLLFSVLAAGLLAAALIMMVLPASIGLWLTLPITMLVPAVLTVLIVNTRGWRRGFCIGALLPAGMAASTGLVLLWIVVANSTYQRGPWNSLPVSARAFQFFAILCWLLMFAAGGVAAAIYVAGQRRHE